MSYVDAGYVIALSVLFVYSLSLIARRRRAERAAAVAERTGETAATAEVSEGDAEKQRR